MSYCDDMSTERYMTGKGRFSCTRVSHGRKDQSVIESHSEIVLPFADRDCPGRCYYSDTAINPAMIGQW